MAQKVLIADNYSHDLRKMAVKALQMNGAGSNPTLRLSLSDDMKVDPGYYQLHLCLATFRRMLLKQVDLQHMWGIWHSHFTGHLRPGPFSRLQQCLETIGWSTVGPPWISDHEGHVWNLKLMDAKTLDTLLEDAWLQQVASSVKHRTMHGLRGIKGFLSKLDANTMTALDRARLSALRGLHGQL